MSSLTAPTSENSHFVAEIYFIFLKICPRSNFKCCQYQISTSIKISEKSLTGKTNFSTSLQITYANFMLKLS